MSHRILVGGHLACKCVQRATHTPRIILWTAECNRKAASKRLKILNSSTISASIEMQCDNL